MLVKVWESEQRIGGAEERVCDWLMGMSPGVFVSYSGWCEVTQQSQLEVDSPERKGNRGVKCPAGAKEGKSQTGSKTEGRQAKMGKEHRGGWWGAEREKEEERE